MNVRDKDKQNEKTFIWPVTSFGLALKLDLATDHFELSVPQWLVELASVVREDQYRRIVHEAKMTDRQALEYHDFLWHLFQEASSWYGSRLAHTCFEDELGALQCELSELLKERDHQRSADVNRLIKNLTAERAAKEAA